MHRLDRGMAMLLVAALGAVCAAACGTAELQMGGRQHQVNQAIWAAEQAGAQDDPRSARLLGQARREMMDARSTADNGDERNAALLFDRAEADSELALQIARTSAEREKARRAWKELGVASSEF
jgi:hypothetical protein